MFEPPGAATGAGDLTLAGGGALIASVVEGADLVVGGGLTADVQHDVLATVGGALRVAASEVALETPGGVDVNLADVRLRSQGDIDVKTTEDAMLDARAATLRTSAGITVDSAAGLDVELGGGLSLGVGEDVDAMVAARVSLLAQDLEAIAAEEILISARSTRVTAAERAVLATEGTRIELVNQREGAVVPFIWKTPAKFDEFWVLFEDRGMASIPNVVEIQILRRGSHDLLTTGPAYVSLDIWDVDKQQWVEVWSKFVSDSAESLENLRLDVGADAYRASTLQGRVHVGGLRLRSSPPINYAFVGWGECEVLFRTMDGAAVAITAEDAVETTAPRVATTARQFDVDAAAISLDAEVLDITTDRFAAIATRFEALTKAATIEASEDVDVFAGGAVNVAAGELVLDAFADADVSAGEDLRMLAEHATLDAAQSVSATTDYARLLTATAELFVADHLQVDAARLGVGVSEGLNIVVGEDIDVSARNINFQADESVRTNQPTSASADRPKP